MPWNCCTQYARKFWKLSNGHRTGKCQFSFQSPKKKGNAKECTNYCTIALISHASKVMLKLLKARLQQYMNHELPDVQAGFRKGTGTRDQHLLDHGKIKIFPEKNLLYWLCQSLCVDHNTLCKILKEMWIPDDLTCLLRNLYAGQEAKVRNGHGRTDWF